MTALFSRYNLVMALNAIWQNYFICTTRFPNLLLYLFLFEVQCSTGGDTNAGVKRASTIRIFLASKKAIA